MKPIEYDYYNLKNEGQWKYLHIISSKCKPHFTVINRSLAASEVTERGAWGE